jgi:hypothetical protein
MLTKGIVGNWATCLEGSGRLIPEAGLTSNVGRKYAKMGECAIETGATKCCRAEQWRLLGCYAVWLL